MEVKWIKIVTDIFDDDKMKIIDALPDADAIIVIWFKLLTQAGKVNKNGALLLNKLAYTDEMLAVVFNRKIATIRLALDTFEDLEMIERGEYIQIANWEKHQNVNSLELIRKQNAARQRKHRAKQKQLEIDAESDVTLPITLGNAPRKENKNKNKKDIKDIGQNDLTDTPQKNPFDTFWEAYPRKVGKDKCLRWFETRKITKEFLEEIIKGLEKSKKSKQWQDVQYIPHPYTWLNRGGWQDELEPVSKSGYDTSAYTI